MKSLLLALGLALATLGCSGAGTDEDVLESDNAVGSRSCDDVVAERMNAVREQGKGAFPLLWAEPLGIRAQSVRVGSDCVRYITAGSSDKPKLLLLHTLRTQLDLFHGMVGELSKHYQVYAYDYPGHGYSDIPHTRYDAPFFTNFTSRFMTELKLDKPIIVGESIGGSIALLLASRGEARSVVAVNPYDYDTEGGITRSGSLAKFLFTYRPILTRVGTALNVSDDFFKTVVEGGVSDVSSIPPALLTEFNLVGRRKGYSRALTSLLKHAGSWVTARDQYKKIDTTKIPTTIVYGSEDWSTEAERKDEVETFVRGATPVTIPEAGHFTSLDKPKELVATILKAVPPDAR